MNNSFKIEKWQQALIDAGCTVAATTPLAVVNKKNGDPLFSLIDAKVTDPEGHRMPNIVFIRGQAVVVVPELEDQSTGEIRFLMVRQRRIGNGQMCLEFPAGMIDHEHDEPVLVGVRELAEETGLTVTRDSLFPLVNVPLYSSAGASDEAIHFFGCTTTVSHDTFLSYCNKSRTNSEEGEYLTVALLTREEAEPQITSIQARLGFYLFDAFLRSKRGC